MYHGRFFPEKLPSTQSGCSVTKCSISFFAVFPTRQMDLFATRHNNHILTFVSPFSRPSRSGSRRSDIQLGGRDLYPPAILVPRVIQRLPEFNCRLTLLWNRSWILEECLLCEPLSLPLRPDLLVQPGSGLFRNGLQLQNRQTFRLLGRLFYQQRIYDLHVVDRILSAHV